MLEKKTLRSLRVPNPKNVEPAVMKKIIELVKKRLDDPSLKQAEEQLDATVSQLYGLSEDDKKLIGLE